MPWRGKQVVSCWEAGNACRGVTSASSPARASPSFCHSHDTRNTTIKIEDNSTFVYSVEKLWTRSIPNVHSLIDSGKIIGKGGGGMTEDIRFIHSADLHLDSPFKNKSHVPDALLERIRKSTFEAFDRLIDAAIQYNVDFVLIAGDLFDEHLRSLKAQVHLRKGFERLAAHQVQAFISHGNHDYVKGAHYSIQFPDNVHTFSSRAVECAPYYKNGQCVAHLYGFSYEQRAVKESMVSQFIRQPGAPLHIAMLHGSLDTNTDHDVYAPFRLQDLYAQQMDYWALGHIHKRQVLSEDPPVIYPGNIQGRSRKEAGEKGCYLIEHHQGKWERRFIPLHTFTYEKVEVTCDDMEAPADIEAFLEQAKQGVEKEGNVMLEVVLKASSGLLKKWDATGLVDEWVQLVNEGEDINDGWVWIDRVHVIDQPVWEEEQLKKSSHFTGEWLRESERITDEELDLWLSPVFEHRKLEKHLQTLSAEDKQRILEQAKVITLEKLMTKEDV
ncbi:DNA repair exonuclease [Halobacillus fulvus]|nr:DNA repair exonuclease [Halobacillus fulvus]